MSAIERSRELVAKRAQDKFDKEELNMYRQKDEQTRLKSMEDSAYTAGVDKGANDAYMDAAAQVQDTINRRNGTIVSGSPEDLMYERGMEQGLSYQEPEAPQGGLLDSIRSRLASATNGVSDWAVNVATPSIPAEQLQRQEDQKAEQSQYDAEQSRFAQEQASAQQMKQILNKSQQ
jgi:hypothetical protein